MILLLQTIMLLIGMSLVILSLAKYINRSGNWHGVWQIWVGQLKDFNPAEFRLFRSAILLLFLAIILRIVNLTLNG
ncbi:hypothetical protein [Ferrimonas lipolytica]|uniref:Uncharacterized protein n=1 Tax=Ferrimonas lipolytica TaxID=2724191 RepID=A0A6H1UCR5_9GAMM|nr:hypothetical protein [Ferrimonas lipolytica]QIZ76861.1 hypothetical protein HER31_08235 [Ferrimonas lipolytica]